MGTSDLDILGKIFQALGTPTEAQWPGMRDLPNFVDFQKTVAPPLGSVVKGVSTICCCQRDLYLYAVVTGVSASMSLSEGSLPVCCGQRGQYLYAVVKEVSTCMLLWPSF